MAEGACDPGRVFHRGGRIHHFFLLRRDILVLLVFEVALFNLIDFLGQLLHILLVQLGFIDR